MVTLVICLKRRADLTFDEFDNHWRNIHAPLIRSSQPFSSYVKRYIQYQIEEDEQEVGDVFGVRGAFDGIELLEFEDSAAMEVALSSPDYLLEIQTDTAKFVDVSACRRIVLQNEALILFG